MRFFSLPEAVKLGCNIAHAPRHSGYVPFSEKGLYGDEALRLYEAYDIGLELSAADKDFLAGNIFYGPNTWPDVPDFRSDVYTYYEAVRTLSLLLTHTIEAALGLPMNTLTNMMRKPTAQLRLIHYPENQVQCRDVASHTMMGAHTDYEFFTLLHQTMPGLQTVDVCGKWVDAPPVPGTLVMNVGDMAEVISGGCYKSNPHRVLNSGLQRFSMPFFAAFDYQSVIRPMVASQLATYPEIVAGDHLLRQVSLDFSYLRSKDPLENKAHINMLTVSPKTNPYLKGKAPWIN
jgi:isopenicillin N synthase-like dioxygenase